MGTNRKEINLHCRFTSLAPAHGVDWDGLSDTDLLVVSKTNAEAEEWADRLLDSGIAEDVIGLDRYAWAQLPHHASAIWRYVARDAVPLLESGQ